jgi:hypothetical protein
MVWDHTRTEREMCVVCWSGLSPAGCTSIQISTTLEYEYRLFVAFIT